MPRSFTDGEGPPTAERTVRAVWLVVAFAALLVGFPLGFALVAGEARAAWFAGLYAALGVLAVLAAFALASARRRRLRTP